MKTGVNTSTIIYVRHRSKKPKGKNCTKCSSLYKGYCREFKIKITDNTNAKVCSKYKGTVETNEPTGTKSSRASKKKYQKLSSKDLKKTRKLREQLEKDPERTIEQLKKMHKIK